MHSDGRRSYGGSPNSEAAGSTAIAAATPSQRPAAATPRSLQRAREGSLLSKRDADGGVDGTSLCKSDAVAYTMGVATGGAPSPLAA
jgi:hypothetical protein